MTAHRPRRAAPGIAPGPAAGNAPADVGARARLAAAVIIVAFLGWMAVGWIGGAAGWPPAVALAVDAACLAALVWALVTLIGVWRARRSKGR